MDYKKLQAVLNEYKEEMLKSENGDAAFILHFSAEDDKFYGFHHNLDVLDLGIVIHQFFDRLSEAIKDCDHIPIFVHYGLAKDIRDKVDDIMKTVEMELENDNNPAD